VEAKAAEAALDQAVPDFPKAALKKHYDTARADAATHRRSKRKPPR